MHRILNTILGIGLLLYIIVWLGSVMHWFKYEKEIYVIVSSVVLIPFLLKYFMSSKIVGKHTLLLVITVTYLTFTSLAKFKLQGLTVFPIIILVSTATLLLIELYDWIKGKPKNQKMNLIQMFCLISFLIMLILRILHYPGGAILMILFHLGLTLVAIELITNNMIKKLILPIFLILSLSGYSQSNIEGTAYSHFQLKSKKDTIDFVIADTNLHVAKPLLLFCQGSQPVPLFLDFGEQGIFPVALNNFQH